MSDRYITLATLARLELDTNHLDCDEEQELADYDAWMEER